MEYDTQGNFKLIENFTTDQDEAEKIIKKGYNINIGQICDPALWKEGFKSGMDVNNLADCEKKCENENCDAFIVSDDNKCTIFQKCNLRIPLTKVERDVLEKMGTSVFKKNKTTSNSLRRNVQMVERKEEFSREKVLREDKKISRENKIKEGVIQKCENEKREIKNSMNTKNELLKQKIDNLDSEHKQTLLQLENLKKENETIKKEINEKKEILKNYRDDVMDESEMTNLKHDILKKKIELAEKKITFLKDNIRDSKKKDVYIFGLIGLLVGLIVYLGFIKK